MVSLEKLRPAHMCLCEHYFILMADVAVVEFLILDRILRPLEPERIHWAALC